MAQIKINDIFDELIEENIEITECLNVLIKFKTFVDLISSKLKSNLGSNDLQMFDDLHKEVEEVFKRNERDFTVNKNFIQKKTQNEILSSKPQTTESNKLQLSSESCKQSINSSKVDGFKSQLSYKKSNVRKQIKQELNKDFSTDENRESNGIQLSSNSCKQSKVKALKLCSTKTSKGGKTVAQKMTKEEGFTFDENKTFICDFIGCGKSYKFRESVTRHMTRCHSNYTKPYVCDFENCNFSTSGRSEMRTHINRHKGVKPYVCDYCEKQFTSDKYRKLHINLMHKVLDEILICGIEGCRNRFKTELSLKFHQKRHFQSREGRFVCTQPNCTYKAVHASTLKTHISTVHNTERNFKCEIEGCGKAFKSSHHLNIHTIIHSDIEFKCDWPGCEYTTKHSYGLTLHQSVHTSERNFLCNWPECDKRFKDKRQLDLHLRIHNCDKRYVCSWPGCQYRCTDSGNFHKHRRVHIKK